MSRSFYVAICLIALGATTVLPGCLAEVEEIGRGLTVAGTVTYHGSPVMKGAIHFLPSAPRGLPASGSIADGVIRDVFTRTQGDGIRPGKYRITIVAFDEAFQESAAKRDFNGPNPDEVTRAADNFKSPIPVRYSNSRESGLVAEIAPGHTTIDLKLVD